MDHQSSSALVWDEKHLKALLRLHHYPARLIQVDPWQSWIEQHGGVGRVLDYLRSGSFPPNQQQILDLILTHPDAPARFYYIRLHVSPSAYFSRLNGLTHSLLLQLNTWRQEPSKPSIKAATTTNLPSALTPLIGAEGSLAATVAILRQPGTRLLTLIGPGGVGKTRLAIAAGTAMLENFPDGVFFVPLETVNDPALVATQIARSLDMETIRAQSSLEAITSFLRDRQMLLILDNFEQLVQGGQMVTDLLRTAGNLKVLVTSREALNLYGEVRFTVPELNRPNPDSLPALERLNQWPALDLFVQRVQARHPQFMVNEANLEAIVRICHRLDGLPLAIELAAAQMRLLSPDQTLPQLEYGLKALRDTSRDRPSRQKTLWDAIDWSYQLLPASEKAMLRLLAVFGREWTLDAAQAVCRVDDLLPSLEDLVDKSLLRYAGQGEEGIARFQMLQPVREFALERLAEGAETEQAQRRHATYFLEMVERAEPAIGTPEQLRWVRRIKQERENLQIALQWMLDKKETEMAFKLLGAAWRYYNMLNIWDETKSWMERALVQGAHSKSAARVKTLWGAAWLATHYKDITQQTILAEQGLTLAREIGDPTLIGLLLQNMADVFRQRREFDQAIALLEESLSMFRRMDNKEEIAWVLYHTAETALSRGERARSLKMYEESLAIFRTIGDQWSAAAALLQIGALALEDGDRQRATEAAAERLEIYRVIGARYLISLTLYDLASLLWQQDKFETLTAMLEESLALSREIGDRAGIARALHFLGRVALLRRSDFAEARKSLEQAQAIVRQIGDPAALGEILADMEHLETAEKRPEKLDNIREKK